MVQDWDMDWWSKRRNRRRGRSKGWEERVGSKVIGWRERRQKRRKRRRRKKKDMKEEKEDKEEMEGDFTRRSGRLAAKLHPCPSATGPDLDNSPPLHIGPQHIIGTHHRWAP